MTAASASNTLAGSSRRVKRHCDSGQKSAAGTLCSEIAYFFAMAPAQTNALPLTALFPTDDELGRLRGKQPNFLTSVATAQHVTAYCVWALEHVKWNTVEEYRKWVRLEYCREMMMITELNRCTSNGCTIAVLANSRDIVSMLLTSDTHYLKSHENSSYAIVQEVISEKLSHIHDRWCICPPWRDGSDGKHGDNDLHHRLCGCLGNDWHHELCIALIGHSAPHTNEQMGTAGALITIETKKFVLAQDEFMPKSKTHAMGIYRPGYVASVLAITEYLHTNNVAIQKIPITERSLCNTGIVGYDRTIALVRERAYGCHPPVPSSTPWQDKPRSMASITRRQEEQDKQYAARLGKKTEGGVVAPAGGAATVKRTHKKRDATVSSEILQLKLADYLGYMERTRKLMPDAHTNRRSLPPAQQDVANRIRDLTELRLQIAASLYSLKPEDDEQEDDDG